MNIEEFKEGRYAWIIYDPIDNIQPHWAKIIKYSDKVRKIDDIGRRRLPFSWITVDSPYGKRTYPDYLITGYRDISDKDYINYINDFKIREYLL